MITTQKQRDYALRAAKAELPSSLQLAGAPIVLYAACVAAERLVCGIAGSFSLHASNMLANARHMARKGIHEATVTSFSAAQMRQLRALGNARLILASSTVAIVVINQTVTYRYALCKYQELLETGQLPVILPTSTSILALQVMDATELTEFLKQQKNLGATSSKAPSRMYSMPLLVPSYSLHDRRGIIDERQRGHEKQVRKRLASAARVAAAAGDGGSMYLGATSLQETLLSRQMPSINHVAIQCGSVSDRVIAVAREVRSCTGCLVTVLSAVENGISTQTFDGKADKSNIRVITVDAGTLMTSRMRSWVLDNTVAKSSEGMLPSSASQGMTESVHNHTNCIQTGKDDDFPETYEEDTAFALIDDIGGVVRWAVASSLQWVAPIVEQTTGRVTAWFAKLRTVSQPRAQVILDWVNDDDSYQSASDVAAIVRTQNCEAVLLGQRRWWQLWRSDTGNPDSIDTTYREAVIVGGYNHDEDAICAAERWREEGHQVLCVTRSTVHEDREGIRFLSWAEVRGELLDEKALALYNVN
jgi:hypothetical protein